MTVSPASNPLVDHVDLAHAAALPGFVDQPPQLLAAGLGALDMGKAQHRAAVQPRHQIRDPPARGALVGLARHCDEGGAQQSVLDHVAGLHLLDDRAGLGIAGGDLHHRLVAVRIERLAD